MIAKAAKMEPWNTQSEPKATKREPEGALKEAKGSQKDAKRDQNASQKRSSDDPRKRYRKLYLNGLTILCFLGWFGSLLPSKVHPKIYADIDDEKVC